jgi:thymidylate synthase (FAD)
MVALRVVRPDFEIWTPEGELQFSLKLAEKAGRVAHLSDDRITEESADPFVRRFALGMGHESFLEHRSITVRIICDRSTSHQLVRHRLAAYTQESQRAVDYSKNKFGGHLKVLLPPSTWNGMAIGGQYRALSMRDELQDRIIPYFDIEMQDDHICLRSGYKGSEYTQRDVHLPWDVHLPSGVPTRLSVWSEAALGSYEGYLRLRGMGMKAEDARSLLPNAAKTEVVATFNIRAWRHVFRERCHRAAQWQIRGIMTEILRFFAAKMPAFFDDLASEFL